MRSPTPALQKAVAAALLADADIRRLAHAGNAVFAPKQAIANVFPRFQLRTPQRVGRGASGPDMIVDIDSFARGPDATLVAGEMGDAVTACLAKRLEVEGHRVSSVEALGSRAVGDPQDDVEHVVTTIRYSLQPA